VRVRVAELTGEAGDVVVMLPWTLHGLAMNCSPAPRFMVTHSLFAAARPA
jgi:ectoine hydroxylase-related dioxygenase (phytanoyl-CoA dioxygenase family)